MRLVRKAVCSQSGSCSIHFSVEGTRILISVNDVRGVSIFQRCDVNLRKNCDFTVSQCVREGCIIHLHLDLSDKEYVVNISRNKRVSLEMVVFIRTSF